jgi:hypothetical protein
VSAILTAGANTAEIPQCLNERTGTMIEFYIYSKAGNYLSTSKAKDLAELAQIKAALENNQQKITITRVGV